MKEEIEAIVLEERNKKLGVSDKVIHRVFMFERLLKRISLSKYNYHLILHGNTIMSLYVHNYHALEDSLDIVLRDSIFTEENILDILNSILGTNLEDGVTFNIMTVSFIRNKIFKVCIVGDNEYTKSIMLNLIITKEGINKYTAKQHGYKSIFNNEKMAFHTYDLETLEAMKYESIVKGGIEKVNFNDVFLSYVFFEELSHLIKVRKLQEALIQVAKYNNSLNKLVNWRLFLEKFENTKTVREDYETYQKINKYAKKIKFNDLVLYIYDVGAIVELPFISEI